MTLDNLFEHHYLPHIRRKLKPKTVAEYTRLYRAEIGPRIGNRALASLTFANAEALHKFVPGRVQANRAASLLSAILAYAAKRDYVDTNVARDVERNRETGREFFYSPAQCKALLSTALEQGGIKEKYIALELLTGCRPGELLNATVGWRKSVTLDGKPCAVIQTPDGKTGGRPIFLSPQATAVLDSIEPLITGRYFPVGMSLRRAWERLCRTAGVPYARLYDLRHTFASAALAAHVTLPVIAQMLGHRKFQTTMRYAHLSPDVGVQGAIAAATRMGV